MVPVKYVHLIKMLNVMMKRTVIELNAESQFVESEKSLQHTEHARSVNHLPLLIYHRCPVVSRMEICSLKVWVDLTVKRAWVHFLDLLSVAESVLSQLVAKEKRSCQMDLAKSVRSLPLYQVMVDNVRCQIANSMKELS